MLRSRCLFKIVNCKKVMLTALLAQKVYLRYEGLLNVPICDLQVYKKTWNLGIISTVGIVVALANFSICIWIRLELSL